MLSRAITYFISRKDADDPERTLQARYFVVSTWIFFLLAVTSLPYFAIVAPEEFDLHPEVVYSNFVFILLILACLFAYRKWGGRILLVNIMAVMGFGSNLQTYEMNGGIWSSDLLWGLIISAWIFLVAGKTSGTIWIALSMGMHIFFLYADLHAHKDFISDATKLGPFYPFFNYFLGAIFLWMIISLYDASRKKFIRQLKTASAEVEQQKKELELQKDDIIASINYARKIQQAVLPHEEIVTRGIPLSFFLYKPRDIVSGDFYWYHETDPQKYILAVADCTGHGVPGAFMTVIGSNLLTQIVKDNKITAPSEILLQLDMRVNETLKQDHARYSEVQDGMDLSLISVDKTKRTITYTSAKRVAFLLRNNTLTELKGSKFSIGGMRSGTKTFEEITVQYADDDLLYMFTDGYIDQFGGPDNKKFMIKRFRELILSTSKLPMPEQKHKLESTINDWIGTNEQTDDILVCGIRF